jgi:hypothetical protein
VKQDYEPSHLANTITFATNVWDLTIEASALAIMNRMLGQVKHSQQSKTVREELGHPCGRPWKPVEFGFRMNL